LKRRDKVTEVTEISLLLLCKRARDRRSLALAL
jgi:hypothetical protein